MKIVRHQFSISGMQCADCENVIEEAVQQLPGIKKASADFTTESLYLEFDREIIAVKTICAAIEKAGYSCRQFAVKKPTGLIKRFFLILLALTAIALLFQLENLIDLGLSPTDLERNLNYGLLFLVGFFTSFHCVGMCGGLVVSYTAASAQAGRSTYLNHLAYGLGKTMSYTTFGAFFGFLGGAVTFTLELRSLAAGLAGGFLIIYGLSMLDAFSGLRRFHIRLPRLFTHILFEKRKKLSNPFAIGLFNGLMIACGPLQAMYILAAGTGDPLQGAKLLFVFALGTLPVMFAFGILTSLITTNTTRHLLKFSGFIIIALGAVMLNRSMLMGNTGYDFNTMASRLSQAVKSRFMTWQHTDTGAHIQDGYQVIYMEAEAKKYHPNEFTLRKGIPVKWIINVKKLSECNRQIVIPDLEMTIDLREGLQVVEFNPSKTGTISWSCHMGMIPGSFIVKE